jgi:hypothetical protein
MKLDEDPLQVNMNTVELEGKKVLVWPSQAESTKGKEAIIGEERQLRMIRSKNPEVGRWKKNEISKSRSRPKATFNIRMVKYRDDKVGIRGHENRTIRFFEIRSVLVLQEASPTTNPGHRRGEIQKVGIVVNRSIIRRLTFRLGHQCLGCGGLRR